MRIPRDFNYHCNVSYFTNKIWVELDLRKRVFCFNFYRINLANFFLVISMKLSIIRKLISEQVTEIWQSTWFNYFCSQSVNFLYWVKNLAFIYFYFLLFKLGRYDFKLFDKNLRFHFFHFFFHFDILLKFVETNVLCICLRLYIR